MNKLVTILACALAGSCVFGDAVSSFDIGADLRVRQEIMDSIPYGGLMGEGVPAPYSNNIRIRSRVWGRLGDEDISLFARVANEFRLYPSPLPRAKKGWRFPDELYLDNLYADFNGIGDFLDLRIGRQDFTGRDTYGHGRLLMEGTAGDGSRSLFFDAVRARLHFNAKEQLDILGIYNEDHDGLDWGRNHAVAGKPHQARQRNQIVPGSMGLEESGAGLYHRSRSFADIPFDAYWIYKRESSAISPKGGKLPGRDINTVGFLAMPKFSDGFSGEIELAYQFGETDDDRDISAEMAYAALEYRAECECRPWLRASCYFMSGDEDPSDGTDKAWNTLWGRYPQIGELNVYFFEYGIGYLSNMVYPALEFGLDLGSHASFKAASGPLYAAEDDSLGHGDGRYIGWYSTAVLSSQIAKDVLGGICSISSHLRGECLTPGDYFASDHSSYFLRWEVMLAF